MNNPTPAALQVAELPTDAYPDNAPPREVLAELRMCAAAWEGGVRVLGNVRAADIVRALDWALQPCATSAEERQIALTALQSEIAALPAPRGTLVQATVLDLIAAKLKGGDRG